MTAAVSVSAGGFDHLVGVRQFSLEATEVSYNQMHVCLGDLFPRCTPMFPSSWPPAWSFHQICQGIAYTGSFPGEAEL